MAEKKVEKTVFDASKFQEKRDEIFEMEKNAEWKVSKTFQHTVAYRKSDNDSVFKFVRNMVGIPKDACIEMVTDPTFRMRYDKSLKEYKILKEADTEEYQYIYMYTPFPFPCTDRDFVSLCKRFDDEATNTTMVLYLNATHPDAPEKPKVIRAETLFSAMIFRPDENDPNSTVFTSILRSDLKGLIPEFVINNLSGGAADTMRADIDKFYKDVYVKEKK